MARWILPRHRQSLQKSLNRSGAIIGVPDRVLNVLVPEVVLQGPGVVVYLGGLDAAKVQ